MLVKADFDAFLQEYWTERKTEDMTFKHRPLLAMMPKNTDVGGEYWVVPVDVDDGADGSPNFDDAQGVSDTTGTDSLRKQFQVQYVEDFQMALISNKLIRLSRKAPALALQRALEESKRKKNVLAGRIARNMYRTGYGELGTVDSSVSALSTAIIGLSNRQDARNFKVGSRVVFAASGTAALRASGAYLTVTKVDWDATAGASITTDAPTSLQASISGITTGDMVFLKGARLSGASPTLQTMQGLGSWIPITAPSGGENFNGVDRSVWADRLAGLRYNSGTAVSGQPHEIMIDAMIDGAIREAHFSKSFVDPAIYGSALKVLESTVTRVNDVKGTNGKGAKTSVGFNGFEVQIGYGSNGIQVFPDANCPPKYQYNLSLETWELGSAGELIQNDLQDGEKRDHQSKSAVEYRYVFTGAMACNAPGLNQVVKYA